MAAPLTRLLAGTLLAACLWTAFDATAASAKRAPRIGPAVAVAPAGKPRAADTACIPIAKRRFGRTVARLSRQVRTQPRRRTAIRRARRRARTAQRRCRARLRHRARRSSRARPSSPTTAAAQAVPLTIAIDGGYAGWGDAETRHREALGAAVTRHEWDPTEEPVDAQDALVLEAASQVRTRIHALLGANELGDPGHYRDWVVAFIRRYGAGGSFWQENPDLDESRYAIRTFELGNEPYFGAMSAAEYADTVQPALEEVKRLGLPAQLILVSRVYGSDTSWMDTLYQRIPDLNSLFHAFADHPYWYGHDPGAGTAAGPFERIGTLRRRMNEQGAAEKPIFITEYGESTASCGSECVDEATQAEHLKAMLDAAIARTEWGIGMVSVYQLIDRGTESADRELQFGLLRQDGTAKPSYSIVRGAMQRHRG